MAKWLSFTTTTTTNYSIFYVQFQLKRHAKNTKEFFGFFPCQKLHVHFWYGFFFLWSILRSALTTLVSWPQIFITKWHNSDRALWSTDSIVGTGVHTHTHTHDTVQFCHSVAPSNPKTIKQRITLTAYKTHRNLSANTKKVKWRNFVALTVNNMLILCHCSHCELHKVFGSHRAHAQPHTQTHKTFSIFNMTDCEKPSGC